MIDASSRCSHERSITDTHSPCPPAWSGRYGATGKQARLARLLAADEIEIEAVDDRRARAAGQLCGVTATADVIDASVVLGAKARGHRIVTSDPEDLERLDPGVELIVI